VSTREWITAAAKKLEIETQLRLVEPHRFQSILERIVATRTKLDKAATDALWWWEALLEPVAYRKAEDPLALLQELVDPNEDIWFVAEANSPSKKLGNFWLYEARIVPVCAVLAECPAFEYYILPRKMDWLLCENHHNLLIGSGEAIVRKLLTGMPNPSVKGTSTSGLRPLAAAPYLER
jgi:hypothetical protein